MTLKNSRLRHCAVGYDFDRRTENGWLSRLLSRTHMMDLNSTLIPWRKDFSLWVVGNINIFRNTRRFDCGQTFFWRFWIHPSSSIYFPISYRNNLRALILHWSMISILCPLFLLWYFLFLVLVHPWSFGYLLIKLMKYAN